MDIIVTMADLFSENLKKRAPLADRMRPGRIDDFLGQEHIVGRGKLLRRAIEADMLTSSIFYGPSRLRKNNAGPYNSRDLRTPRLKS